MLHKNKFYVIFSVLHSVFRNEVSKMKSKEQLFEMLRNVLQENAISVYSLAKITGINRSTLQKAMNGTRSLTLRQFKSLIDALPLSARENEYFYIGFMECSWDSERIKNNRYMLDILDTISGTLGSTPAPSVSIKVKYENTKSVYYGSENVKDVATMLVYDELFTADKPEIRLYVPLSDEFANNTVTRFVCGCEKPVSVSLLFEFLKSAKYSTTANLSSLKTIIPMILDSRERFKLYYFYADDYVYRSHPTPYPYYIILSDKAVMLDAELESAIVISDAEIVNAMKCTHDKKAADASPLQSAQVDLSKNISILMNNHVMDTDMYAISYEPCISCFVPAQMYSELITDDMPHKEEFVALVADRLTQITDVPTKYALFNKDSISDFVREGSIVPFKHPCLKMCTLRQRREILTNIYNTMDDTKVIMRAFSSDKINVTKNYELTDIQCNLNFQMLIYGENSTFRLITINEPIISRTVINFFKDIIETHYTFTYEQTRQLIKDNIALLDKMIADEEGLTNS